MTRHQSPQSCRLTIVQSGRCHRFITATAATLISISPLHAIVTTAMDDFNSGAINVSAANGGTDAQTETGLPPTSVISGIRQTQVTATASLPTTVTSSGGPPAITYPLGSLVSTSNINFIYNAGSNTFPSGGLGLDLSHMVAFKVDVTTPVNIFGFQIRIFDIVGNSKVATKNAFANTSATYTFLPSDFSGGSVYGTVHTVWLTLGGIGTFNLNAGGNISTVDNFMLETNPPPVTPKIIDLTVNGAGDAIITVAGTTTGLSVQHSPDLATTFSLLTLDPSNITANTFTVPAATLATLDGGLNDGSHFFRVSN